MIQSGDVKALIKRKLTKRKSRSYSRLISDYKREAYRKINEKDVNLLTSVAKPDYSRTKQKDTVILSRSARGHYFGEFKDKNYLFYSYPKAHFYRSKIKKMKKEFFSRLLNFPSQDSSDTQKAAQKAPKKSKYSKRMSVSTVAKIGLMFKKTRNGSGSLRSKEGRKKRKGQQKGPQKASRTPLGTKTRIVRKKINFIEQIKEVEGEDRADNRKGDSRRKSFTEFETNSRMSKLDALGITKERSYRKIKKSRLLEELNDHESLLVKQSTLMSCIKPLDLASAFAEPLTPQPSSIVRKGEKKLSNNSNFKLPIIRAGDGAPEIKRRYRFKQNRHKNDSIMVGHPSQILNQLPKKSLYSSMRLKKLNERSESPLFRVNERRKFRGVTHAYLRLIQRTQEKEDSGRKKVASSLASNSQGHSKSGIYSQSRRRKKILDLRRTGKGKNRVKFKKGAAPFYLYLDKRYKAVMEGKGSDRIKRFTFYNSKAKSHQSSSMRRHKRLF